MSGSRAMIAATLGGVAALGLIVGLIALFMSADAPNNAPASKRQTSAQAAPLLLDLPPAQLPSPAALRFVRHKDARVGALTLDQAELTLFSAGLSRCEDGWALQGFYLDAQGKPAATEPISLGAAPQLNQPLTIEQPTPPPDGPPGAQPDPEPRVALVTLEQLSHDRVAGTITLKIGAREAWRMRLDARPTGLAPDALLSGRSCHMTGYFTLGEQGGPQIAGPVFGANPGPNLYTARIPLDADEALVVMIGRKIAQQNTPLEVRDAPLQLAQATDAPVRVYLARRDPSAPDGWAPTSLDGGLATLRWPERAPSGPAELTLKDMKIPASWTGRLSGRNAPLELRALVMFPIDPDGLIVPLPPTPAWWPGALER